MKIIYHSDSSLLTASPYHSEDYINFPVNNYFDVSFPVKEVIS
ncbi:hypothetical protein [Marivirga aurantiaca]|nr:hypothetical protein [Marivirga aurantiaca]